MTKSLRVAVLTTVLALAAAPVFADPGGTDPPPPPPTNYYSASAATVIATVASAFTP
jgi:hypothetical protein